MISDTKDLLDTGDGFYLIYKTCDYCKIIKSFEKMQENSSLLKIRVRAALHLGSVEEDNAFDKKGYVGSGLDETNRFAENAALRTSLDNNSGVNFVYGISGKLYETVKNETWFNDRFYKVYDIMVKSFSAEFYLNTNKLSNIPPKQCNSNNGSNLKIKNIFLQFLKQSDFIYKNKQNISSNLDTFFIYPDLSVDEDNISEPKKIKSEILLEKFISSPTDIILYGAEQCGKTSLAKTYFKVLCDSKKYFPVYIKFNEKEKGLIKNKIDKAISKEYEIKSETLPKVIILDDFHKLDLKTQTKTLDDIGKIKNAYCIIFVESEFRESLARERLVKNFKHYSIRMLGYVKRSELIDKWISFTNLEDKNYKTSDELQEFINKTLLNGVIPYAPFYILTLLAAKMDSLPLDTEITSKGHCYQALIMLGMKQMNLNTQSEINVIQNFFGYIAFEMYKNGHTDYTDDDLQKIFKTFINKYNWDIEYKDVLKLLAKNNIFTKNTLGLYSFKGVYFYYYFVARYISNKLNEDYYYDIVKNMIENLNEQDKGYIIVFLIHHTRNIILFDEIQLNTMLAYESDKEIKIDDVDTKRIDDIFRNIKEITISAYDNSKANREKIATDMDENKAYERNNSKLESITNQDINNEMLILKKTIKTVEVLGQILKNHNGEIEKEKLEECIVTGINTMRRMCSHLLSEINSSEKDFIDMLSSKLDEKSENKKLTNAEKEKIIHKFISAISFTIMCITIIGCGKTLISKELVNILKSIYKKEKIPINFCIYIYCSLWYKKEIPINELKKDFHKYPVVIQTIIRLIVKDYTDMHSINYKDKGKLAEALEMPIESLAIDYSK